MDQDEDLLLMADEYVALLLDEAAEGCPKRDYVLEIVAHHARDSAHHALWDGATEIDARLRTLGEWARLARATRSEELTTYLERLASYADRRPVDHDEARQRVLDLRRCDPSPAIEPDVRREGHRWSARFDRANAAPGRLIIDAERGVMHAVALEGL